MPKTSLRQRRVFISDEIKAYLREKDIKPINGKPIHPQTRGKIEMYQRTMKNAVRLDNYFSPEVMIKVINEFLNYYNYERYHGSLKT